MITLGDPDASLSSGDWWQGIKFLNTSNSGESVLKYCDIRGATNLQVELETAVYCENSSPIFDHCIFRYIGSSEMTGGSSAIGLREQSYPIISYCGFVNIVNGVAIWCNPYNIQDTIYYHSPLVIGCDFMESVGGIQWPGCDHDKIILYGGFLDNCYFKVGGLFCDTTLGNPIDTLGDGICNTTSTYQLKPRFLLVDGVVNPRDAFLITGVNENEIDILPTTSTYLTLNNNYPNPFSENTTIEFEIEIINSFINLAIFDSKGRLVKRLIDNKLFPKGKHSITWYGEDDVGQKVKEGIYFYKLTAGNSLLVKKAIVVKS